MLGESGQLQSTTRPDAGGLRTLGPAATVAIVALVLAILDMTFLITFALVKNCSPTNIAVFMVFFSADVVLALVGFAASLLGMRKTRNLRLIAALLLLIYASLIILMLRLIAG